MSATSYGFVRELVLSRSGIVLDHGKDYLIESRLLPIAKEVGCASIDEVVNKARGGTGGALREKVVEALTTNETSFFRDLYPFEAMRRDILPRLEKHRTLRIWCAACSTGQEPYSLAMMIAEHVPEARSRISILATDLSEQVLARARLGRYRQLEVNRGLPAAMLLKYFRRDGADWQLDPGILSMVQFRTMNLIEPGWSLPTFDVVFIRNVLIYFDVETKKAVLGRVRRVLAPGGILFLGGAETATNLDDAFERVPTGRAFYYRVKEPTPREGR